MNEILLPDATLFVTRPQPEADKLCASLRARGRNAIAFPVIEIESLPADADLKRAMTQVEDYRLVIFVSPNAIRRALAHRRGPWPASVTIGVMGPVSRSMLAKLEGADVVSPGSRSSDDVGERFDSESLFAALDEAIGLTRGFGGRVLIVRGVGGRAWFADRLRSIGITVEEVEAYRRVLPRVDPDATEALRLALHQDERVVFIVTSSEGVTNLVTMVQRSLDGLAPAERVRSWLFANTILAPHRRIADKAREVGFSSVTLCGPGDQGIRAAIE